LLAQLFVDGTRKQPTSADGYKKTLGAMCGCKFHVALISFLNPQPPFRNLVVAGRKIVVVTAGCKTFIGHLHPPTTCFFAL
jgi:hypothetical protein